MSRTVKVSTLAVLVGLLCGGVTVARAATREKVVRYHGYAIRVPASWPVFNLRTHPLVCARFNRHAVYLGEPSAQQRCPAHAVGRTEAILIAPLTAGAARAGEARLAVSGGRSTRVVRAHGRLLLTATWGRHPGLIRRALRVRALPAAAPAPTAGGTAHAAAVITARSAAVTTGLGFDACSTPSQSAMTAWSSSPYRTVGVYLGGANMACSQPNLNGSWVSAESAAGWHLIPTYVGLQAPHNSCGCAAISSSDASAQGASEAADAVTHAQAVGLGNGNPIYFDMESYPRGGSTTATVLAFLSSWTATLHADGYLSGVYSSAASGISDLVAAIGTSFQEPDDIWIADWNGTQSTSDPYVPGGDWASHQRIHQYSGGENQTYGGVTINIDGDYVDAATGSGSPLVPDGTFVQVSGTNPIYRVAGGAPLWVSSWTGFGGPQTVTTISQAQFSLLNPYPADGTFLLTTTGRIFRVAGGAPLLVHSWSVFGGPQPSVTIDEWDVENTGTWLSHLRASPASGTVVEGLPSATYWRFTATGRVPVTPSSTAVAVDDEALYAYAIQPAVSSLNCVVPSLRHMTVNRARRALSRAHCRLGKVRRPRHVARHHLLRVRAQTPHAHGLHRVGYRVGIWVR